MRPLARRIALAALLLTPAGGLGGCTLVKPLAGAIAVPALVIAGSDCLPIGCGCHDGRGVAAFFVVSAAIGVGAGLVTGIISDVRALTGHARDPTANWYDPFATN